VNNIVAFKDESTLDSLNPFPQESPEIFFPVFEREIEIVGKDGSHFPTHGRKAVCRVHPLDDSRPLDLGIVKRTYKTTPMKSITDEAERAFLEFMNPMQLAGAYCADLSSRHGAWVSRRYTFPGMRAPVAETSFQYQAWVNNGYDGLTKIMIISGCFDTACANGQVIGEASFDSRKHTSGVEIPNLVKPIKQGLIDYQERIRECNKWAEISLSDSTVESILPKFPGMSERRAKRLLVQWHEEKGNRGANVWALVSALTFYSSHNDSDVGFGIRQTHDSDGRPSDNESETLSKRGSEVRKWINSSAFNSLIAA